MLMPGAHPNRLRTLRSARGISLAAIAADLGVHESTVSRWESGISGIPDARKQQLAELFDVSVSYLMGWDEPNGNGGVREVA